MAKRILSIIGLIFGTIGVIACTVVIFYIWSVSFRLADATVTLFDVGDKMLHGAGERVEQIDSRVQSLKITTNEIEQTAKNWVKKEAAEAVGSKLHVQEKAEALLVELDKAEKWLEITEQSALVMQHGIDVTQSLGLNVDVEPAQKLMTEIDGIQTQLDEGLEIARNISQRVAELGDEKLETNATEQIAKLALRVTATLGLIDGRIEQIKGALQKLEVALYHYEKEVLMWVNLTAWGLTFLFVWLGAGQGALCYLGWRGFHSHKPTADDSQAASTP
ncbi:hypothetical protein LOC68_03170 [Blastopirellula sp. JC732]|uniref:Uncharacterized protein n=1 Tax=Blastopirellula sediminis TaxID=2894196 RepID=A0A9X1SFC8_9BACT|nr:hypothetical protein [Blastopirellula sediminis]MCC9607821.1 hypothetical protein [Blastopirellula sediminis]MCC9627386.1 hypothetical protein [Blastopirellula sediminis]